MWGCGLFALRNNKKGELVHNGGKSDIIFSHATNWQWCIFFLPRSIACNTMDWTWTQGGGLRTECCELEVRKQDRAKFEHLCWDVLISRRERKFCTSKEVMTKTGEVLVCEHDSFDCAFTTHHWSWQRNHWVQCIMPVLRKGISRWAYKIQKGDNWM